MPDRDEHTTWPLKSVKRVLDSPSTQEHINNTIEKLRQLGFAEDSASDAVQELAQEALCMEHALRTGASDDKLHPLLILVERFKNEDEWWEEFYRLSRSRAARRRSSSKERTSMQFKIEGAERSYERTNDSMKLPPGVLEELSLKERAVFVLMREGFTQNEISGLLHVSASRVSQLKAAAIRRLSTAVRRLRGQ